MKKRNELIRAVFFPAFLGLFLVLAFRSFTLEGREPITVGYVFSCIVMTIFFGAPQLLLLRRIMASKKPFSVVIMSIGSYAYAWLLFWLGWYPWQEPLRMGEGHFEFPLALLGQWIIFAVLILIDRSEVNDQTRRP